MYLDLQKAIKSGGLHIEGNHNVETTSNGVTTKAPKAQARPNPRVAPKEIPQYEKVRRALESNRIKGVVASGRGVGP